MTPLLPQRPSLKAYHALYAKPRRVEPAIVAICARHGLAGLPIQWMPGGMNMLFAVGPEHVVKLFAPLYADDFDRECAAMGIATGALAIPMPQLLAQGELEGWPYLVLTRLQGRTAQAVWDEVPHRDRVTIATQLGAIVKALHQLPAPDALRVNWPVFLASQALNAPDTQARWGATAAWTGQIPDFLAAHPLPSDSHLVLLHADLHGRNVLLDKVRGRWRLAGILDFGDAFVGAREYEFAAPAQWLFRGEPALFASFLEAYGYGDRPDDFPTQMMAWTLHHRFAYLPKTRTLALPHRPRTLKSLAGHVFTS